MPQPRRRGTERKATDNNLFSARRSQKEFLNKNQPDTAKEPIRFLKGVSFGEAAGGKPCGSVDGEGNAEYLTAVIRELLRSTEFVDGLTGEGWQLWIDLLLNRFPSTFPSYFELFRNRLLTSFCSVCPACATTRSCAMNWCR